MTQKLICFFILSTFITLAGGCLRSASPPDNQGVEPDDVAATPEPTSDLQNDNCTVNETQARGCRNGYCLARISKTDLTRHTECICFKNFAGPKCQTFRKPAPVVQVGSLAPGLIALIVVGVVIVVAIVILVIIIYRKRKKAQEHVSQQLNSLRQMDSITSNGAHGNHMGRIVVDDEELQPLDSTRNNNTKMSP